MADTSKYTINLSAPATLTATLGAGKINVNDYTLAVEEAENGVKLTLTRGSKTETVFIPNGAKGDKGEKGDKGDTGAQGVQGEKGAQGEKGDKGDKGDKGEQGIQGEKGDTGEKGDKGEQGDRGDKGDKGDTGEKGDTGAKGDPGVQGPKGDPGSDASVTAENIQSALGYAPVKDVQVAGSSVLDGGVANVPIASETKEGVIKAPFAAFGLQLNNDNRPYVSAASETDITARQTFYRPLVPARIDYAVKSAMCDGKGAAWTAAEQKAARERMGVDKAYELIDTITTDGTSIIERSQEPDGTSYNFTAIKVVITSPKNLPASETIYARGFLGGQSTGSYVSFGANVGYYKRSTFAWRIENSAVIAYATKPTILYSAQNNNGCDYSEIVMTPDVIVTNGNIAKCMVYCGSTSNATPMSAGYLIKVYGVRA